MSPRRGQQLIGLLFLLEIIATFLDLRLGPGTRVSTEERYNAIAGAQIACGHVDSLWALQYRPFCGGCTAEALLAAPLFGLLGTGALVWKLVPAGFHLLLVGAGLLLACELAGTTAAVVFLGFVLSAPEFFRELSLTGFGNHAEGSALVLLSAALLARACRTEPRSSGWPSPALLFLSGLVAGGSVWFCRTDAYALPGLLLVALLGRRLQALVLGVGLLVGLIPFILQLQAAPFVLAADPLHPASAMPAPPSTLYRWLIGDFMQGGLWSAGPQGELDVGGAFLWLGLLVLGLGGAVLHLRHNTRPGLRSLPVLLLGGLLLAWLCRYDLWDDNPAVRGYDPFNLRYRLPFLPLLWLGAAVGASALGAPDRLASSRLPRLSLGALLGGWLILGGVRRLGGWNEADHPPALVAGDRADATMPVGDPPQRLDRAQGRPQDIAAARRFLDGHEDSLPICRQDHLHELGRRIGLGAKGSTEDALCDALPEDPLPDQATALRAGLRRGLEQAAPAGELAPSVPPALCACRPWLCAETTD